MNDYYKLILEMDTLKTILRNTTTLLDRRESTAEHSWSAAMIAMILLDELKNEFGEIDELKIIKLILIHDVVEIYAGDVSAFDIDARKNKEKAELEALKKIVEIYPPFGEKLSFLWHEFENKKTLEAKIAKAADAICPIFQRLHTKTSYRPHKIDLAMLEKTKYPNFVFSKTFIKLYEQLKSDLLKENLIEK